MKRQQIVDDAQRAAEEMVKNTRHELDLLIGELRRQQNLDLEVVVQAQRQKLMEKQKQLQVQLKTQSPAEKGGGRNLRLVNWLRLKL